MLKVVIVYLQGSGGNLLARTLALDENTVPFVPQHLADTQPNLKWSKQQRLATYNNWNNNNWVQTEKKLGIWYHHDMVDFVDYENSDLMLIDTFHPAAFIDENCRKILWNNLDQWQHRVLINWDDDDLEEILLLARLKRKDLQHVFQIRQTELSSFAQVKQLPNFHYVQWKDMLQLDSYILTITQLADKLNLELDKDLVSQLWISWKQQTDKIRLNNE